MKTLQNEYILIIKITANVTGIVMFILNVSVLFWCHFQQTVKNSRDLLSGIDENEK